MASSFMRVNQIDVEIDKKYKKKYENAIKYLKPGDIVLTSRFGWPEGGMGTIIRKITKSKYSHSAIYVGGGKIVEAIGQGVVVSELKKYFNGANRVDFRRFKNVNDSHRLKVASEALKIAKKHPKYDDEQLWRIFGAYIKAGGNISKMKLSEYNKEKYICSELVFVAAQNAGIVAHKGVTRADITPEKLSRSKQTIDIKKGIDVEPKFYEIKRASYRDRGKGIGKASAMALTVTGSKSVLHKIKSPFITVRDFFKMRPRRL